MSLTKASNIRVAKSGFWIFAEWRVHVSQRRYFKLTLGQYKDLFSRDGAVAVVQDEKRVLWRYAGEFYWDSDGLSQEEVDLLLWDRSRRLESRLSRLRKIRVRAEDIEISRRERIPDEVRAHVWERDQGACVRCGAEDELQFDHVIPVAKGGGTGVENIQLLCGDCNRLKSDSIA